METTKIEEYVRLIEDDKRSRERLFVEALNKLQEQYNVVIVPSITIENDTMKTILKIRAN